MESVWGLPAPPEGRALGGPRGGRAALLRLVSPRHAELATAVWRQITKASSSNATTTRRLIGASTASS